MSGAHTVHSLDANVYGSLPQQSADTHRRGGIDDPRADACRRLLHERRVVFLLRLLVDMVLHGTLATAVGDIEQGALHGFARDVLSRGLGNLFLDEMVYHLLLHDRIDGDMLPFQLRLHHADIVFYGLRVPLAGVVHLRAVAVHCRHTAVGTRRSGHEHAVGGVVACGLLRLQAVEVVTDLIHDGYYPGSEDVGLSGCCHIM